MGARSAPRVCAFRAGGGRRGSLASGRGAEALPPGLPPASPPGGVSGATRLSAAAGPGSTSSLVDFLVPFGPFAARKPDGLGAPKPCKIKLHSLGEKKAFPPLSGGKRELV